jgi:hypothetical protein
MIASGQSYSYEHSIAGCSMALLTGAREIFDDGYPGRSAETNAYRELGMGETVNF